jgi:uncharacterized membrane protein
MNPEILLYEPRGPMRIFNWYLYAYLVCATAFLLGAWSLARSRAGGLAGAGHLLIGTRRSGVVLLFLLLNIEIADFYATGPTIMFRFGVTLSQDLTYTIGWLMFGMALLAACIYLHSRFGRVAALVLIALTTFKVLPLRPRLARRAVSRRLFRRTRHVACTRLACPPEVCSCKPEEQA